MSITALKVVPGSGVTRKELELIPESLSGESHSLHQSVTFIDGSKPEIPLYFISRYSKAGEVVLDPFSGSGTTALEANLSGRVSFSSDFSPLALLATQAKVSPADITEVTLKLQGVNFKRPVGLGDYTKYFSPFFDIDTFRELSNLRAFLLREEDRTAQFIMLVALSLLHGQSAGYYSAYSSPLVSITPAEQQELNGKRRQYPDFRAVLPRILRKTASLMRDGYPSIMTRVANANRFALTDARDLSYVPSSSIDLVVTAPPLPLGTDYTAENWLKLWFAGVNSRSVSESVFKEASLNAWLDFMNEVLLELARVVKGGRRAVFELKEAVVEGRVLQLEEELLALADTSLSRYWEVEAVILDKVKGTALKDSLRERDETKLSRRSRILVLRRR